MPKRIARIAVTVIASTLFPSVVLAQAELQGHVFSETGRRPLVNAGVSVPKLNLHASTDSLGRYRLQNIPRGEHLVITRAVGFRPDSALTSFDGDEALVSDVVLRVAVNELPTVVVRESTRPIPRGKMAEFEERKAVGVGHFIDRELLVKDENRRLGEILASHVPGLSVYRGTGSKAWAASSRTASTGKCAMCRVTRSEIMDPSDAAAGAPLACYLDVYLDGTAVYSSSTRGVALFNLNSMEAGEIEAIEVYTGVSQIPAKYNKTSGGCGVMLIWTRVGNRE